MINFTEKTVEIQQLSITDCTQLNRIEMVGMISLDIMCQDYDEETKQHFRHIFKGITRGPWTIESYDTNNSMNYTLDDGYEIQFIPCGDNITVKYFKLDNNFYKTIWPIEILQNEFA